MKDASNKSKIIVICGPTAVGKTRFAIELAQRFRGAIVGADAMQIYRYMDIGTAKPTAAERAAVSHHLVDIVDPDQDFDAAAYTQVAQACIAELLGQGVVPFVVGGTGLYIKALVHGLFEAPPADANLRKRLKKTAEAIGTQALHRRLQKIDAATAHRLHPNDTFRIIRALEVYEATGQPLSVFHQGHGFAHPRFDALKIGLILPRHQLYARVDQRVDKDMIAGGLLAEVRALLAKGYDPNLKAMQSLGYRHMIDFIAGRLDFDEAVRLLKRDHRHYAKRQLTWFRADETIHWLPPDALAAAIRLLTRFLGPR